MGLVGQLHTSSLDPCRYEGNFYDEGGVPATTPDVNKQRTFSGGKPEEILHLTASATKGRTKLARH